MRYINRFGMLRLLLLAVLATAQGPVYREFTERADFLGPFNGTLKVEFNITQIGRVVYLKTNDNFACWMETRDCSKSDSPIFPPGSQVVPPYFSNLKRQLEVRQNAIYSDKFPFPPSIMPNRTECFEVVLLDGWLLPRYTRGVFQISPRGVMINEGVCQIYDGSVPQQLIYGSFGGFYGFSVGYVI